MCKEHSDTKVIRFPEPSEHTEYVVRVLEDVKERFRKNEQVRGFVVTLSPGGEAIVQSLHCDTVSGVALAEIAKQSFVERMGG